MPPRYLRVVLVASAFAVVVTITLLALSRGGVATPAATPGNSTPTAGSSPAATPAASSVGAPASPPRPTPGGPPDPVVHFNGVPIDHHTVLPALPAPPARTAVPSTLHDTPGQARPDGGYHTPTAGQ